MNNVIKKMCQSVKKLAHFLFVNIKFILMLNCFKNNKKALLWVDYQHF